METMHPVVLMMSEIFGLIAVLMFAGVLAGSRLLSVRMRHSLQWVFICLACGLLVGAVEGAPQFVVRREGHIAPLLLAGAGILAISGDFLTQPLEAEGPTVLGGRVCRGLMGVVGVLCVLLYTVEALTHHYDLDWLVREWRQWS